MESFAPDLRYTPRTPLTEAHVAAIREIASELVFEEGERVSDVGAPMDRFCYLLEGEIEVIDPFTFESFLPNRLGPGQFTGEMALLYGGAHIFPQRACSRTRVLCVSRDEILKLMAQIPEMGDIIIDVFNGRRRRAIESGDSSLTLIGASEYRMLRRIASFASRSRIGYRDLTIGCPDARAIADVCGVPADQPLVVFGKDRVVEDPSPRAVAAILGLDLKVQEAETFDVLIVGGGPAGVAASVYAGAEGLTSVVVDEIAIGGQAGTSSRIENYMGFPTGISGADLLWRGQVQAMKFGARFAMPRRVSGLRKDAAGLFHATLDDGVTICAKAVVIATGVQYRRLPLARLEEFEGAGIYYAATEAEARYTRGRPVAVIGGGNSAGQAAMFLSEQSEHVHVLVRSGSLAASMSDYLSSRLEASRRITIHYNTQVTALSGEENLSSITITEKVGGASQELDVSGLFVMAGAAPNTDWLGDLVQADDKGFVRTGPSVGCDSPFQTSVPGLFAVGDVRAGSVKRVASAAGEGSVVISRVWEHVKSFDL